MKRPLFAVVMAGGSGTRFWPLSRASRPKQFQRIASAKAMIEEAIERARSVTARDRILVAGARDHEESLRETCRGVPPENLLFEPAGRDTAPAIGLAALAVEKRKKGALMLVLPADHLVHPVEEFAKAVRQGARWVEESDDLVTFGIPPDHPATGYGYLERGDRLSRSRPLPAYRVARFHEKPDLATARRFLSGGLHFWNGGIFLWRAARIRREIARHLPRLARRLDRIGRALGTAAEGKVLAREYRAMERVSIDYGVMEKAQGVAVVVAAFRWDDLGGWEALARHLAAGPDGNRARGEHVSLGGRDLLVVAPEGHLVGTIGVEGLAIVVTRDATLVCPKSRAQEVKKLVERLRETGRERWT